MEKIILDTNFLMSIFELKIDIFEEINRIFSSKAELYIVEGTLKELEKFINSPLLSKKQAAKLALKCITLKKIKVLKTGSTMLVDDVLLSMDGYIIATMDAVLKKELRKKDTNILAIRQKKYLIME